MIMAYFIFMLLLVYIAIELGWGGVDPRNPNHNVSSSRRRFW
jgi:hypothetical protein